MLASSICGARLTYKVFCVLEWQGADFSGEHLLIPSVLLPTLLETLGWSGRPDRAVLSYMGTLRSCRQPAQSPICWDLVRRRASNTVSHRTGLGPKAHQKPLQVGERRISGAWL